MDVGTKVGARRWPYHAAHPDCWGRPHSGVVLSRRDPRAWQDTMRFAGQLPSQAEVDAIVDANDARCSGQYDTVPVLWTFGEEQVAYFERIDRLRPYAKDLADWTASLWAAKHPMEKAA